MHTILQRKFTLSKIRIYPNEKVPKNGKIRKYSKANEKHLKVGNYKIFKNRLLKKKDNSLSHTPGMMNNMLKKIMKYENKLLAKKKKFPFGVGIVCVLRKI